MGYGEMYLLNLFFRVRLCTIILLYISTDILFRIPVTNFVSQDIYGCKTRRRVRLSKRVRGTEFGYDARILFGTYAADSRETCGHYKPREHRDVIIIINTTLIFWRIVWHEFLAKQGRGTLCPQFCFKNPVTESYFHEIINSMRLIN